MKPSISLFCLVRTPAFVTHLMPDHLEVGWQYQEVLPFLDLG